MDWRTWAYGTLTDAELPHDASGRVYSTLGEEETPEERPFIVVRFDPVAPAAKIGTLGAVTVWVHDEPGSYTRIDDLLGAIRSALVGPVAESGGIACDWIGDSADLSDDGRGTVVRNTSFRLAGRIAS